MPTRQFLIFIGSSMLGGMFAAMLAGALMPSSLQWGSAERALQALGVIGLVAGCVIGLLVFAFLGMVANDGKRMPRTGRGWSMVGFGAGFVVTGGLAFVLSGC